MSSKFSSWDERYSEDVYHYGIEPNDFLRERAADLEPGGTVLCLAEGEGRNAVHLAERGFVVTAVDGAAMGLRKLEALAKTRGVQVQTVCADLADFDMGTEEWDAIVSIWAHLPVSLRQQVHRKAVAALRPGGLFVLEAYTPKQLEFKTGGPPTVDLLMNLSDLRQELAPLELLHGVEIERVVQEGRGHNGRSAVVQIVARKR